MSVDGEQVIDEGNRKAKARIALFRALLAMRGAKIVAMEHDKFTVQCLPGDEQGVRDLAVKFGIAIGGGS